jgi:hypothetical protein
VKLRFPVFLLNVHHTALDVPTPTPIPGPEYHALLSYLLVCEGSPTNVARGKITNALQKHASRLSIHEPTFILQNFQLLYLILNTARQLLEEFGYSRCHVGQTF